jgi:hypothetical protein
VNTVSIVPFGLPTCPAALAFGDKTVLHALVGEGDARHEIVIAAPLGDGVEGFRRHALI